VVSERELEGGRIEVVLELPLTGPVGYQIYCRIVLDIMGCG
jgi:hypothetical protein